VQRGSMLSGMEHIYIDRYGWRTSVADAGLERSLNQDEFRLD